MKIFVFVVLGLCITYAKINIIASIAPEKTFIDYIGKDKVNVLVLVKPNHSPHNYEPSPSDMRMVSNASAYFSIGIEFEDIWLEKLISQNKKIEVFKIDKNIKKISIKERHQGRHHKHSKDPHIWLNPDNVKTISKNILNSLIKLDKINKDFYIKNYNNFIAKIIKTDLIIKNNLSNLKNKYFMVFHPSWGYFAKYYGLSQLAIEVQGKNPTPKEMIRIIKKAKQYNIKYVISTPQTSDTIVKQIAKTLEIKVIKINPLSSNWSKSLIYLSNILSE